MTVILPSYFRATAVPDQLRGRQCRLCRTPIDEAYDFCFRCNSQPFARPDVAGFVTYAVKGGQSGAEMYRYKNHRPSPQALKNVLLLLQYGLLHLPCAGRLMGTPSEAVAVVPSRSHYQPDTLSKLQQLCHRVLLECMPLVSLRPAPESTSDRRIHGSAFEVVDCPYASHVTIIDDTWVSGGTTLSAVAALRASGVQKVSVLALARWLDPRYGLTRDFLAIGRQHLAEWPGPQDVCPFTLDGICP